MKHSVAVYRHWCYRRARTWAEYRAWAYPGVRFTASLGKGRLSCWVDDGRMHFRTWYIEKEDK